MQFVFIKDVTNTLPLRDDEITEVERRYNFRFPDVLREYYLRYNNCSIVSSALCIENAWYEVTRIIPVVRGDYTFDKVKANTIDEPEVPASYYPVAFDPYGNKFLWDSLSGTVWFYYSDGDEELQFLFANIEQFFEAMNTAIRDGEYVRKERGGEKQFLPLGSVVEVKDNAQKLIIVARGMNVEYGGEAFFFDYCGALYPDGVVSDQFIYFDDGNIGRIYFTGYHDDEDAVAIARLNAYIASHPELRRYVP